MSSIKGLASQYKAHFYSAKNDSMKGYQMSLALMAGFLMLVVAIDFTDIGKAIGVFMALSFWLAIFPFIFPKDKPGD